MLLEFTELSFLATDHEDADPEASGDFGAAVRSFSRELATLDEPAIDDDSGTSPPLTPVAWPLPPPPDVMRELEDEDSALLVALALDVLEDDELLELSTAIGAIVKSVAEPFASIFVRPPCTE